MAALSALLRAWKRARAKVLLFSHSTQMLDILEDGLARESYSFLRLDGATPAAQRTRLVDQFNAPDSTVFVFLLSTRAG
eukprot:5199023-Pleurochrysis_carterae.AAC.1